MQSLRKDFIVYKDNEIYKQMTLPIDKSKEYCAKLNRTYPNSSWSIALRVYPIETD